ncbi:unnamed protein product, partial [Allacma fusca]
PKSPREEGTTESKDIEEVKDLNAPDEPGLGEAEKEEMNKALLTALHLQKHGPNNTCIQIAANNVTMHGDNVGVIDIPESSDALNAYIVAKNVVVKEGTSVGLVLTDGNPNGCGKSIHTVANSYTNKPGSTVIGAVGTKETVNFTLDIADRIRNSSVNSQGPQIQSINFSPRSSNPHSKAPVKKHCNNVRTLRDCEDNPEGKTLRGNTVTEGCSSHAITEQVRVKRLNSPQYIQNLARNN